MDQKITATSYSREDLLALKDRLQDELNALTGDFGTQRAYALAA